MTRTFLSTTLVLLALTASPAWAADAWVEWRSDDFGFQMTIPPKMKMTAAALGEWGGMRGELPPVQLAGLAKLNSFPELPAMQAFAIAQLGIPAAAWTLLDQAENQRGWKWFKTYRAVNKGRFVYALLGHGPRGAYVVYLSTTPANRALFNAAYVKWYESLTVF